MATEFLFHATMKEVRGRKIWQMVKQNHGFHIKTVAIMLYHFLSETFNEIFQYPTKFEQFQGTLLEYILLLGMISIKRTSEGNSKSNIFLLYTMINGTLIKNILNIPWTSILEVFKMVKTHNKHLIWLNSINIHQWVTKTENLINFDHLIAPWLNISLITSPYINPINQHRK